MNRTKKLLSLLLAFVMVFLVACGGPQGGGKKKESTGESKSESTETKTEGTKLEPKELKVAGANSITTMDYLVSGKQADNGWNVNFVETLLDYNNVGQLVGFSGIMGII